MLAILAEAALRSACLALLLAAGLWMVRSSNPYLERSLWRALLGIALLMPALMLLSRTPAAALVAVPQLSVVRLSASIEPHWQQAALWWLYSSVAALLLLRQVFAWTSACNLLRQAAKVHAPWTGQLDVRVCAEIETPATVGSTILLPPDFVTWTEQQRDAVLEHERTHVRHRDFLVLALAHLHRALFWFNPLAWWLPNRLAMLGENLSDDAALARMADRETYARLLLAFAARRSLQAGAVAMARPSNITIRVQRIVSGTPIAKPPSMLMRAALMSGVLTATVLAAGCDSKPATGSNKTASAAPMAGDKPPSSNRAQPLSIPDYPAESRQRSEQGTVVLSLHVLPDGKVDGVQIKTSSGFHSLDVAAAQEAWEWTLDPAVTAGQAVAAWGQFAVTFTLED